MKKSKKGSCLEFVAKNMVGHPDIGRSATYEALILALIQDKTGKNYVSSSEIREAFPKLQDSKKFIEEFRSFTLGRKQGVCQAVQGKDNVFALNLDKNKIGKNLYKEKVSITESSFEIDRLKAEIKELKAMLVQQDSQASAIELNDRVNTILENPVEMKAKVKSNITLKDLAPRACKVYEDIYNSIYMSSSVKKGAKKQIRSLENVYLAAQWMLTRKEPKRLSAANIVKASKELKVPVSANTIFMNKNICNFFNALKEEVKHG